MGCLSSFPDQLGVEVFPPATSRLVVAGIRAWLVGERIATNNRDQMELLYKMPDKAGIPRQDV